jgi:hypothetical protein
MDKSHSVVSSCFLHWFSVGVYQDFLPKGAALCFSWIIARLLSAIAPWRAKLTTLSCVAHPIDFVFTSKILFENWLQSKFGSFIVSNLYSSSLVRLCLPGSSPHSLSRLYVILSYLCNATAGKYRAIKLNPRFLSSNVFVTTKASTERGEHGTRRPKYLYERLFSWRSS